MKLQIEIDIDKLPRCNQTAQVSSVLEHLAREMLDTFGRLRPGDHLIHHGSAIVGTWQVRESRE